ncbi:hypothetical protein PIROE2DRAFT_5632 [Piromyces sp. E2]|nr:hypothetical protein PIROE2DRAFT_5632 [Piromyces sp. E2]|eukprot:OUM67023.1 hypothetical protein PIROE2DRAFT_5632 [Piromyces sp. E2]
MFFEIRVSKKGNSNISIRIPIKNFKNELMPEQTLNLDDVAYCFWDGEKLQIISRGILGNNVKIISNDIPIALVSFKSINCEVYSPKLEIGGVTIIEYLEVYCGKPNEVNFVINGGLITNYLNVNCSLEINGEIYFKKYGILNNDSIGLFKMVVNGRLSFENKLIIKNGKCSYVDIINNGVIMSENEEQKEKREEGKLGEVESILSCSYNTFINEKNGIIKLKQGIFNTGEKFENSGKHYFRNFSITGRIGIKDFQQKGLCHVEETATLYCGVISSGETLIHHLVFPEKLGYSIINIKVVQGNTLIDKITGSLSSIDSKNGANFEIGEIDGNTEFIESSGNNSRLILNKLKSGKKIVLSSNSGGTTILNEGDAPESFLYSDNGLLVISNIKGKTTAFVNGKTNLKVYNAENLTLVANDEAKADIAQSSLKDAYLKNKNSTIFKSKVNEIYNHSKLTTGDIQANRINNYGNMEFWNKTSTNKIDNYGEFTCRDGDHHIKNLNLLNSKLKVKGSEIKEIEGGRKLLLRESDNLIDPTIKALLIDAKAKVSVGNISGGGSVECKNQLYKQIPTSLEITGNTYIQMDRMPDPGEIPIHNGSLLINVDMDKDYINNRNVDYGDAMFILKMHDKHKWVNNGSIFAANALMVENSTEFLNKNGIINLEEGLYVKTKHFKSKATPITRENGRRVDIEFWGHHLSFYCPAQYHSKNNDTGIYVFDGDIYIESDNNIENIFDNIYTSGNINAYAKGKFVNTVGSIRADGYRKSTIKASEIRNECLPAICRQGEGHASGSSGGFFNHSSWSIHCRIREWITQSHGSTMSFGGDVDLGPTKNIGSAINSFGILRGNVNNQSIFENTATLDTGGFALEGDNINIENARIIARDNILNYKTLEN